MKQKTGMKGAAKLKRRKERNEDYIKDVARENIIWMWCE